MTKPKRKLTRRQRLLLLARLLDGVPKGRFDMRRWIRAPDCSGDCDYPALIKKLAAHECGYAGCAIDWGMTDKRIRGLCKRPIDLVTDLMPDQTDLDDWVRIFGPDRNVTPKRVASDIRRYLKDGTLPKE